MNDSEKLDFIINELCGMKSDMGGMKSDMTGMKSELAGMKSDMTSMKSELADMKSDMTGMKSDISDLKDQVKKIQLHLENTTDRNIELLAENHCTLIDKLNQAIPAASKNLAYEVKVNYLIEKIPLMEKDIADLKAKIA